MRDINLAVSFASRALRARRLGAYRAVIVLRRAAVKHGKAALAGGMN